MSEESENKSAEWDTMMAMEVPKASEDRLEATQSLRWGLMQKHVRDSGNEKMLGQLNTLANNFDKQELVKMRMAQDKEEGAANREAAQEVFALMLKNGTMPGQTNVAEPEIESSGMEILDDELLQGDDTLNSVIKTDAEA